METVKIDTPLKDAWNKRKENLNTDVKYTVATKLSIGDYVAIKGAANNIYTGFVKKIGRTILTIESPYGGWADSDYIQIMDLKFPKADLQAFYKSK
jgi:hypothetical protein